MGGGAEGRMCQLVAREREGAVCSFTISKRISICSNNGLKRERERKREREKQIWKECSRSLSVLYPEGYKYIFEILLSEGGQ